MKKNQIKSLRLCIETLRRLDTSKVKGGWEWTQWPCPAPEPETRGFSNCAYCGPDDQGTASTDQLGCCRDYDITIAW